MQQARDGLDPDAQLRFVLESLASLFRVEAASTPAGYDQNFRVGLFVEERGGLVVRGGSFLG